MTRIKRKTSTDHTPSPNQRMIIPKNTTTTSESPNSNVKPRRFLMTAASRRIQVLIKDTVIGRSKVQAQKDTNQKSKSSQTNARSLGKKSQRGRELSWLELPELKTPLHLDEKTLESYIHHRNCKYRIIFCRVAIHPIHIKIPSSAALENKSAR